VSRGRVEQPVRNGGIHREAAGKHRSNGLNQIFRRRPLEQVTADPGIECLAQISAILMQGQNQNAHRGNLAADPPAEHDAVELGHGDIDHRHIGLLLAND